ncbi:MAG: hypothetical protein ACE14T_02565 [Syntrophales bacterium]
MSVHFQKMSIDEYADLERKNGSRILQSGGIFWQEVRPFFFRPLYPLSAIPRGSAKPPWSSGLIGFQHMIPDPSAANSRMNFFVLDNLRGYSIRTLRHKYRASLKKAHRHLVVKLIDDHEELISAGHRIYTAFFKRTHYGWKGDRIDRASFEKWADIFYYHPKVLLFGTYHEKGLCSINIAYQVEDIVFFATSFGDPEALRAKGPELALHWVREAARGCDSAKYIFMGSPSIRQGLDDFKIRRGCTLLSVPAYYRINPVALFLVKMLSPSNYRKLVG